MKKKGYFVLAGFAALVLLLRFSTFRWSALNWDESLFLLMGRSLLRGEAPYAAVWEHSPLGTATLFALAQAIFGESVVAIRIAAWSAVTITSFTLYRLGNLLGRRSAGWIAGLTYAVFSASANGLATHREILFAPFIALALYMVLSCEADESCSSRKMAARFLLAGLLLGFGLQIKYLFAFDVAAVWLIATFVLWPHRPATIGAFVGRTLKYYALLAVGPLLFLLLAAGYTAFKGNFGDYLMANFLAPAAYVGRGELSFAALARRLVNQVSGHPLLWASLALTPFYLIRARDVTTRERRDFLFVLLWFAAAFVGTLISGRLWAHYFLQLLAPLCLLTGLLVAGVLRVEVNRDPVARSIALALLIVAPLIPIAYSSTTSSLRLMYHHFVRGEALSADGPTQIAAYLRDRVQPDEAIYIADYQPILYYLLPSRLPTRYVFPPHLIDIEDEDMQRIQPTLQLDRIMAQRPRYVVRTAGSSSTINNIPFAEALNRYLTEQYTLEKTFQTTDAFGTPPLAVELYRLKP